MTLSASRLQLEVRPRPSHPSTMGVDLGAGDSNDLTGVPS